MEGLASHIVPYLILLLNTVLAAVARKVLLTVSPGFVQLLIGEVIATIELCADCAELGKKQFTVPWQYPFRFLFLEISIVL